MPQKAFIVKNTEKIQYALDDILSRELPDGGFGYLDAGHLSAEASAWAVLAIKASGLHMDAADRACRQLSMIQQSDGSVSALAGHTKAVWCTPVCILAWKCLPGFDRAINAGIGFLLNFQGRHSTKAPDSPAGHDTSIVGWPWIEDTHSWIEPTSLSMMALKAGGYENHPRMLEAARMILNRQLPSGGWNYGNTTVFGTELLPTPENTGQALCALGGMVDEISVRNSLKYLSACTPDIRTPMALSWMLYGLAAWSVLPQKWESWVIESLELQNRYGKYNTVLLAQLVSVYFANGNLMGILV
jgi:hypothetical protein